MKLVLVRMKALLLERMRLVLERMRLVLERMRLVLERMRLVQVLSMPALLVRYMRLLDLNKSMLARSQCSCNRVLLDMRLIVASCILVELEYSLVLVHFHSWLIFCKILLGLMNSFVELDLSMKVLSSSLELELVRYS